MLCSQWPYTESYTESYVAKINVEHLLTEIFQLTWQ